MSTISSNSTTSGSFPTQKNNVPPPASMNDNSINNLSQFSTLLASPNATTMPFWSIPMQSPLDTNMFGFNAFPSVSTPTAQQLLNSPIFQQTTNLNQPPIIQPIQIMNNGLPPMTNPLTSATSNSLLQPMTPSNFGMLYSKFEQQLQSMMNLDGMNQIAASIEDLPIMENTCNLQSHDNSHKFNMLSNDNPSQFEEELVRESKRKRKRKRKIKEEETTDEDEDIKDIKPPAAKRRRGRRKKHANGSNQRDELEILSQKMKERNEKLFAKNTKPMDSGFIGIRTVDGEVKVSIPAKIDVEYELFGDACTDKIEDILQAKGRTRYVRGLSEQEKKDRRREQNRNAAARSRARKNAMISKVIQLHQENLGLRAHTAKTISTLKKLRQEVETLRTTSHNQNQKNQ
eukprot:20076_1